MPSFPGRLALLVGLAAAAAACAGGRSARGGAELPVYQGHYTTSFEASWFRPCQAAAGDSLWWVTLSDRALRQRDSLLDVRETTYPARGAFVRWRGTVGPLTAAGHLGRGTRYLYVDDIIEVRAAAPRDCARAGPRSAT